MQRFQHFQQLPPEQRAHVMRNYRRWQAMTPDERAAARRRFRMRRHGLEPRDGLHPLTHPPLR